MNTDLDCRNGVLQFYNFGRDGAISAGDAHKLSHVKNEEVNYFR